MERPVPWPDRLGCPSRPELLCKSLAEEEVADNLLTQIAREMMSESRTGLTKTPKRTRVTAGADSED